VNGSSGPPHDRLTGCGRLPGLILLLTLALTAACSQTPEPIQVEGTTITILNQTSEDWKDLVITVNDHFRGGVPLLKAEGRMNASARDMTTGLGQRWPAGTGIRKVELRATAASGEPVILEWEGGRMRQNR